MNHVFTILAFALISSVSAQTVLPPNYPYNPDSDGDEFVAVSDVLMSVASYDNEFQVQSIMVDTLSLEEAIEILLQRQAQNQQDLIHGISSALSNVEGFDPCPLQWSCGCPLSYQGYDYETVLIGEQCWFAENLRTAHYTTGEVLAQFVPDSIWIESSEPAASYYNEAITDCNGLQLGNNECTIPAIEDYGLLYNGYALSSPLALCPSGWHVAEKTELELVFNFLLEQGWDGAIGQGLFSQEVGFNAQKGGYRLHDGEFLQMDEYAYLWTNSIGPGGRWLIKFNESTEEMEWLDYSLPRHGLSVRCIQDSE